MTRSETDDSTFRVLNAILTATALALAGCSGSGSSGEFTAVDPTGASDTARDADGEDTGGEEKCEVDDAGNEGETEVDPSQFEAYGSYIVAAWDGARGLVPSLSSRPSTCRPHVNFIDAPAFA